MICPPGSPPFRLEHEVPTATGTALALVADLVQQTLIGKEERK